MDPLYGVSSSGSKEGCDVLTGEAQTRLDQRKNDTFADLAMSVDIAKARASDLVFDHLRTAIIRGDLQPGERLSEEEVAATASLSRTPVREAFRRLEAEGLIRRLPRNGVEIIGITYEDFMEIFEIRRLLEPEAVRKAAEGATPETIQTLESLQSEMERAITAGDNERTVACHAEWTVTLLQMCGNKRLTNLLATYSEYIRKSSLMALKVQGEDALRTHRALTEAIKQKDPEKARALYEAHLAFAYQTAKSVVSVGSTCS